MGRRRRQARRARRHRQGRDDRVLLQPPARLLRRHGRPDRPQRRTRHLLRHGRRDGQTMESRQPRQAHRNGPARLAQPHRGQVRPHRSLRQGRPLRGSRRRRPGLPGREQGYRRRGHRRQGPAPADLFRSLPPHRRHHGRVEPGRPRQVRERQAPHGNRVQRGLRRSRDEERVRCRQFAQAFHGASPGGDRPRQDRQPVRNPERQAEAGRDADQRVLRESLQHFLLDHAPRGHSEMAQYPVRKSFRRLPVFQGYRMRI